MVTKITIVVEVEHEDEDAFDDEALDELLETVEDALPGNPPVIRESSINSEEA